VIEKRVASEGRGRREHPPEQAVQVVVFCGAVGVKSGRRRQSRTAHARRLCFAVCAAFSVRLSLSARHVKMLFTKSARSSGKR